MRNLELSEYPSVLSTDTEFTWYSETVKKDCKCHLRIYKIKLDYSIVIVSELPDNPRSISDEASKLINLICYQFGLASYKTMWIEHYPVGDINNDESFHEVMLGIAGISVNRINKTKLESLLAIKL